MNKNRFENAKGRITDSMQDGYCNRLNDDYFYFEIGEDDKEVMEWGIDFFKNLIEEEYDRTVTNIEFSDDGYDDAWEEHVWTVEVDF